ncbi:MAG TPA: hypothetical protein VGE43_08525, partial [Acidimicrobiales bacterium]
MSSLHQTLADLARDHGTELFRDASAFRGSLDDYLDEGQASSGTINLLTDAVRLGALDGMLSMLSSGASAGSAVESAGQRLARDRGSADIRGCQWAVAVLGFALGRIPEELVVGLAPGSGTTPGSMPAAPPPPPSAAPPAPAATPAPPSYPVYAPAPSAGQPTGPSSHPAPTWQQPAPHKSRAGLLIGAIAVGLVMLVVVIIGIVVVLRSGGDNSPPAADPTSSAPSDDSSDEPTGDPTDEPTTETEVPDIGGPTFSG